MHTLQGIAAPTVGHRVKLALKAVQEAQISTKQKAPITYQLFSQMWSLIQSFNNSALLKAMLGLGFFGALRGSEYSAVVQDGAVVAPVIADIVFTKYQQAPAMVYTIKKSKTRRSPIPVAIGCTKGPCCAVCAMTEYMIQRSLEGTLHAHAYLFIDNQGRPVSKQALNSTIKALAYQLGLDSANYSTHSLRAGAATTAHGVGLTESQIKSLGHWASGAYYAYIRHIDTHSFATAQRLTQDL